MSRYHPLKVASIDRLTDDSVAITLAVPDALNGTFDYKAGQYLSFKADINGEDVRRSYSISSAPSDDDLRIGVKEVPGGKFSTYANNELSVGDLLEAMPPQGKFTYDPEPTAKNQFVFFAAGSGITPILGLITDILENEPLSQVFLFYGNSRSDSIMFREELEALKNSYLNRFSLHFILSRERQSVPFYNGRIDEEKCEIFSKVFFQLRSIKRFFICGPEPMIIAVKDWLTNEGVEEERVAFELFTTPSSRPYKSVEREKEERFDGTSSSHVTVRIDGSTVEFDLAYGGENILDAAIKAGADAPFSCKGGVCSTCKAMLMEGEVDMDNVYGLEPDEVDDGYILTCQSHPRSEHILVDYDV